MKLTGRTIPEILRERAKKNPEEIAYIFDGREYTFAQCDKITDYLAGKLFEKGIRSGTHVGIWGVNTIEWVFHYFAVLKLGAVGVLINYSYKAHELKNILSYADVEYLIYGEAKGELDYAKILESIFPKLPILKEYFSMDSLISGDRETERILSGKQTEPEEWEKNVPKEKDVAVIIFTSGTTCQPKGVLLCHGQLVSAMNCVVDKMKWGREDRLLLPLPLFHGSGANCGLLVSILAGMSIVLMRYYSSVSAMELIEKYHCTVFNAVPSMLLLMIKNKHFKEYDLSSIRSGTIAGSAISEENYRKVCEMFNTDKLLLAYGMTETSSLNTLTKYDEDLGERLDNVGNPFEGVEIRIWNCKEKKEARPGETGEIQIRGDCVMLGYYGMEEKTKEKMLPGGWFCTGDAGFLDTKGKLHFKTRLSEMIVRGGENISPPEIECCLELFDERISAVKVIGVEAPVIQEEVVAFIKADALTIKEKEIKAFVKERLADFKVPEYVYQLEEFPMTGSGKIDTGALKEIAKQKIKEKERREEKE